MVFRSLGLVRGQRAAVEAAPRACSGEGLIQDIRDKTSLKLEEDLIALGQSHLTKQQQRARSTPTTDTL